MANGRIRNFMRCALSLTEIALELTYNVRTASIMTSTDADYGPDLTIVGNFAEQDGSTGYQDDGNQYASDRFATLNCNDLQPVLKIGDKVKNPNGDEFWIISAPKISAHGKAKYNLSSTESIASGTDRGRF